MSHSLPLTSSIYSANLSFEVFFFCLRQLLKNQLAKQIERAGHDDAAIFLDYHQCKFLPPLEWFLVLLPVKGVKSTLKMSIDKNDCSCYLVKLVNIGNAKEDGNHLRAAF